ncbi:50S ribosomal protein L19e [uncultured archaeon]|nr:50S ribosomal protein L19e [uncultured archaeon]
MAMNTVRRIASELLGVGESKVRFKPEEASKIGESLTREDVRTLIKDGSVYAIEPRGVSRVRGREKTAQKKKGRRSGKGSKKGTHSARLSDKVVWIAKVRAQRRFLRQLIDGKKIEQGSTRKIYSMVKGNAFKGVKAMEIYLKDNKLIK